MNRSWLERHAYVLFLVPGLVLYGLFMVYPLGSSLGYSFFHWDGLVRGSFAGLENFRAVLTRSPYQERFWGALGHNALFFVSTLAIQSTVGLALAALFRKKWRGFGFFQTVYFVPYTLSMVVVGFLWLMLLNPTWGAFNQALRAVGLGGWVQPWLGQTETALPTIILVNAWRWLGFPVLVFLAGLQGIPDEFHEAATVDGATGWQAFRHVTLPLLAPVLGMMTILTFIWDFNAFELVFVMQGSSGNPYYATDLLGTLFYRTAFGDSTTGGEPGQIGIASAIAVLMLLLIGAVSYLGVRQMQKRQVEY
ncbi:carbohydrate ABC transporter permease [Limnochorda pilosa]|uniref:carbohydrate ABC transporter permease n=1 Tax=Limnochorda pilosa TaxID=1555112 RepID=UPI000A4C4101|nr:sugar ABC transporter permease [Limnochorda pilosa]